mgnify:CR=1 FL=1
MKKDIVWKLDLFFYKTLLQKRGRLKLLTSVIVSQQVTRTVCKKISIFFFQNARTR